MMALPLDPLRFSPRAEGGTCPHCHQYVDFLLPVEEHLTPEQRADVEKLNKLLLELQEKRRKDPLALIQELQR